MVLVARTLPSPKEGGAYYDPQTTYYTHARKEQILRRRAGPAQLLFPGRGDYKPRTPSKLLGHARKRRARICCLVHITSK